MSLNCDEITCTLPQIIVRVRLFHVRFFFGILTAETCGLIIVGWTTTVAGPGLWENLGPGSRHVYSVETSLSIASWDMYFDGATRTNEKES